MFFKRKHFKFNPFYFSECNFKQTSKIHTMSYEAIYGEVDKNEKKFIHRLSEAIKIPSISADLKNREDIATMLNWTERLMTNLGIKCEQFRNGKHVHADGSSVQLPSVLYGHLGEDPAKKTLLIYGHLDVQPADISDGWDTEPFELAEHDGKLFGRGTSDDKGPVLAWLNAIEVMQSLGIEIPVNLKFLFEGMEESGSLGLEQILIAHKDPILKNVDFVCISDNKWIGKSKPCVTYGLRGNCYYNVEVCGPKQDLHSGSFGGTIAEPMNDLCWVLGELTDANAMIRIPGIYELVAKVTEKELLHYDSIDFNLPDVCQCIGVEKLTVESQRDFLKKLWHCPSLSVHGIEGAFYGPGSKTVIPHKVKGKFSIRTVPNMKPDDVNKLVVSHLNELWKQRGSPNKFKIVPIENCYPWVGNFSDDHFKAAARAVRRVFGVEPDFTRTGGSIPITQILQQMTGKSVMLLPIAAVDDMDHSQNEKINTTNYISGTKMFASYILECGSL